MRTLSFILCFVMLSRNALIAFETPKQGTYMGFSNLKDVDWGQRFLDILKHLSAQRVNHKLTAEEYAAKLSKIRQAILAKKQREERRKLEEDRDSELLRNTILLDTPLTSNPLVNRINELDRMVNILDKLMIHLESKAMEAVTTPPVEITQCPAVPTVAKQKEKEKNTLSSMSPKTQDVPKIEAPEIPYKHQTERDLSKFQSNYRQNELAPQGSGYVAAGGSGFNAPPAPAPKQPVSFLQPAFNQPPAPQPPLAPVYQSPAGQNYQPPRGYNQQGYEQQQVGYEDRELTGYKEEETDEDNWNEEKPKRRKASSKGNGPDKRYKGRRPTRDEDRRLTENSTRGEGDKKEDDNQESILDTVIMFIFAVIATQVCILVFLIVLKDKMIACVNFKYGQIEVNAVPEN